MDETKMWVNLSIEIERVYSDGDKGVGTKSLKTRNIEIFNLPFFRFSSIAPPEPPMKNFVWQHMDPNRN